MFVRSEAERDLLAAHDWYDRRRSGLGDEFLDEVTLALLELERNPELPWLYFQQFRRVRLRRFPYKLFYQVHGERVIVSGCCTGIRPMTGACRCSRGRRPRSEVPTG